MNLSSDKHMTRKGKIKNHGCVRDSKLGMNVKLSFKANVAVELPEDDQRKSRA